MPSSYGTVFTLPSQWQVTIGPLRYEYVTIPVRAVIIRLPRRQRATQAANPSSQDQRRPHRQGQRELRAKNEHHHEHLIAQ